MASGHGSTKLLSPRQCAFSGIYFIKIKLSTCREHQEARIRGATNVVTTKRAQKAKQATVRTQRSLTVQSMGCVIYHKDCTVLWRNTER